MCVLSKRKRWQEIGEGKANKRDRVRDTENGEKRIQRGRGEDDEKKGIIDMREWKR